MSEELSHEASSTDIPNESPPELEGSPMAIGSLVGLVSGLLGGVLVWLVHRAIYPVFHIPAKLMVPTMTVPPELLAAQRAAVAQVDFYHATLIIGLFGAILGIALCVGEFICRRSRRRVVLGVAVCGLTGALFGCLAGILGQVTYEYLKWNVEVSSSTRTICVHGLMLAVLGSGVGLGFGAVAGRVRIAASCAAYGFLAGMLAGILHPVLAVLLFSPINIDVIIPSNYGVTLLWAGLSSALIGLLVAGAAQKSAPQKKPSPESEIVA